MLQHIGRITCDSHHNLATIQGIGGEINCLNFCTLWEGVCTDIFSISDYVCRSKFDSRNKHSDNAPTSSVDELQGVSPLPSCRFYTPGHDHGVHNFPSLALYPHGATEAFVFAVPYDNVSDISDFYQSHIKYIQVLQQIGILTCDSHHNFAVIQGIECEINCLNFCTC